MLATDNTITCSKCRLDKPRDLFYRDRRSRLGRRSTCKSCDRLADADESIKAKSSERKNLKLTCPDGMLPCFACMKHKDFLCFHVNTSKKSGRASMCSECYCQYIKRQSIVVARKKNRKTSGAWSYSSEYSWIKKLKCFFGITKEEYYQILEKQGGVCAICRKHHDTKIKHLDVDHCHETGLVRGILCRACNNGIGLFRDRSDLADSAVKYLRATPFLDRVKTTAPKFIKRTEIEPDGKKFCSSCGEAKDIELFGKNAINPDGKQNRCKACLSFRQIETRHGIYYRDFLELKGKFNGRCHICLDDFSGRESYIDHCHKSGKIRGVLCRLCNFAIGKFNDDTDLIESASSYLKTGS